MTARKENPRDPKDPRDLKVYKFVHKDLGIEQLTRHDLKEKYDLHIRSLAKVIRGERNHTGGWYLNEIIVKPKPTPKKYKYKYKSRRKLKKDYKKSPYHIKGPKHPQADQKIYKFVHKEHGVRNLTQSALRRRYSLNSQRLLKVLNGKNGHTKGWYLNKIKPNKVRDPKIYKFVHKDLGVQYLTRYKLTDKYDLYYNSVSKVIQGVRGSTGGWHLNEIPPKKPKYTLEDLLKAWEMFGNINKRKEPEYVFVDTTLDTGEYTVYKDNKTITGTRSYIRDNSNMSWNDLTKLIRGQAKSTRGWRLLSDER